MRLSRFTIDRANGLARLGIWTLCALSFVTQPAGSQTRPGLDTTTFVVMGEGLAAGMANFGLSSIVQSYSFPAQMAAQMKTAFPQPLMEPPGIGDVIGYSGQEVRLPVYPQGTVRIFPGQPNPNDDAPTLFVLNLSVPGFTLNDALTARPVTPIVQASMKQTVTNMILGFPQLFFRNAQGGSVQLWTQFEYAKAMFPTVALVELGFHEAMNAAAAGDPALMPDAAAFGVSYSAVLAGLRGLHAQVIATTIPNPLDTAYFSPAGTAAAIVYAASGVLTTGYGLGTGDYVTRNGLTNIALQISSRTLEPLPVGSTLRATTAADIAARVNALNAQIINAAKANGAVLYDLNAFLHTIRSTGAAVGARRINADYMNGFYSLDGIYPGATGHALIANDILAFLNRTYGVSIPPVDVAAVAAGDAVMQYVRPAGQLFTESQLGLSPGPQENP